MKELLTQGEHYNARGLTPEAVARSFVAPAQFSAVSSSGNCVLVGPRGSGKTTLLRMLDPRALLEWEVHAGGSSNVDYVGVFVPIDAVWVSSLSNALKSKEEREDAGAYLAVYALSAARSIVDIMRWRISEEGANSSFRVAMNSDLEAEVASRMSSIWLPSTSVARSFLELRVNISLEIADLPRRWHRSDDLVKAEMARNYANPLDLIASTCDIFNLYVGEEGRKWALLCDELEIAPLSIQKVLFGALRAAPAPLLLKYAITPRKQIPLGSSAEMSLPANDYEVISLSHATREEGIPERDRERFCVALWKGVVQEMKPTQLGELSNPFRIFEDPVLVSSEYVVARRDRSADQRQGLDEKFGAIFRELATKDVSFRCYVENRGVDLSNLDSCATSVKDSVIRKVRPLVEIRNYYMVSDEDSRLKRGSRKASAPYCGAKRIFAVSEGHPRWLKYTLAAMLTNLTNGLEIRVVDQGREIDNSVYRIDARIKALPSKGASVSEFIKKLGEYFRDQVLGSDFRADPYLSFVVDEDVDEDVLGCLEQALYIGAVIPMKDDVFDILTRGLVGHRFRLSNWLAPLYKLPLLAGKATSLNSILRYSSRGPRESVPQLALRFEK